MTEEENKDEVKPMSVLDEARAERERLTKLKDEVKAEADRLEQLRADALISGTAGLRPHQETPEEAYKKRIEAAAKEIADAFK